ncbi:MAG: hypothetical protein GXO86_01385 [Chlorobi bacterium]|nr:hypothetical protein [Chlorobiota bacterium]
MNRSVKYQILILILIFLTAGIRAQQMIFLNNLEDSAYSAPWINVQLSDSGIAHTGNYCSINEGTTNPFGLGIEMRFPEGVKNKNTTLKIEGWAQNMGGPGLATFVICIEENGKSWFWKGIDLFAGSPEKNKWYKFSDSLLIPANVTKNSVFKAYLWNRAKNDTIAVDDLKIEFSRFPNPSYIPKLQPEKVNTSPDSNHVLFKNNFYQVEYDPGRKIISVLNGNGKRIIDAIRFYSKREVDGNILTNQPEWEKVSVKNGKKGTEILSKTGDKLSDFQLKLICKPGNPAIEFIINEKYNTVQEIIREAVVLESSVEIGEVYRANRLSDTGNFQNQYWLDKEGVKFDDSTGSWLIYHTPDVSSLQLNTDKKQLWVNLDYEKDHPFLHFPLNNDTTDEKMDWSRSTYKKGIKKQFAFTVYTGIVAGALPRFMKNPAGFEAAYIWTEHADFTDIRTNRAVYFGADTIKNAEDATGGFVKYDIRVTKSVFYDNPDSVTNTKDSDGLFNGPECSIITDPSFFVLLEQLNNRGNEICLHTPENKTSNRKRMKKALRFMRENFGSPTWIDHGYNNHLENNREDLVCDATIKESGNYLLKLWRKYGVNYFYNPYYEDYFTFARWQFYYFLSKPYVGFGDFLPDPGYWKHPSRTGNIVHWPTKGVLYAPRESDWDYYFNDQVLEEFISGRGVEINHCYPPRVNPEKGFWRYGSDSTVIASPGFNKTLERMAGLKKAGRLNVTTIKDFLDYQLAVEKVKYEILTDGRVKVTNGGDKTIKNLSFAVRADTVTVDGQIPRQKTAGGDIIFWFDLGAGESKVISTADSY